MNTKKLIETICENWGAKIICFSMAILVSLFFKMSNLEKKSYAIPLDTSTDGLLVNSSDIPTFVRVTIRTKNSNFASITPKNISAALNLSCYSESGSYRVPVQLALSSTLLLMEPLEVSVKPEYVNVELDEKVSKYINVKPAISGDVEHGYLLEKVDVVPSTVKVIGPSQVMKNLKYIYTSKVNVKGAKKDFSTEVRLDNITPLVKPYPEGNFKVTVQVKASPSESKFENIAPRLVGLDDKFINNASIPPVTFVLSGTVPVLEAFKIKDTTVTVDCSSITQEGSYELPLNIDVGEDLVLKSQSLDKVTLTIKNSIKSEDEEEKINFEDVFVEQEE